MIARVLIERLSELPPETPVHLYLDHDPNVPEGTVPVHGIDRGDDRVILVGDYPEVD